MKDKFEGGVTKLGVAPSFKGGPNYVFLVGEGWALTNGAENPEGAIAWINFFMNPQILAQWASQHYGVPVIDEAFNSDAFNNEFYQVNRVNLAENGIFIEPSEFYVESLNKLAETLQELMLNPDMDILDALQEAQDEIINRYH